MNKKTVVSIEDRIPKLKEARKKKANRRLITYLCAFFLLISIIVYLQSPLSHVKHIKVNGNKFLTNQNAIELSEITKTTNIWTLNKKSVADNMQINPIVKSVEINRKLPQTIVLDITERNVIGYVHKKGYYQPTVDNGSILDVKTKKMSGDAPLLNNFKKDKSFKAMAKQLGELDPTIRLLISEVSWKPQDENKDKIQLLMNDGYIVESTISGFAEKMDVYPSIVSQLDPGSKGIIHIGVGAYFEAIK